MIIISSSSKKKKKKKKTSLLPRHGRLSSALLDSIVFVCLSMLLLIPRLLSSTDN
jgi:hypothetical protein